VKTGGGHFERGGKRAGLVGITMGNFLSPCCCLLAVRRESHSEAINVIAPVGYGCQATVLVLGNGRV